MDIEISDLCAGYGRIPAFSRVTLSIRHGETWALIGKNGAGKSTFVKCLAGLVPPTAGAIAVDGKPLRSYTAREIARIISYVPQASDRQLPPYSVVDYVMLGRFPYQGFMALPSANDMGIVYEALSVTDTDHLARRPMGELSGGEAQRVFLAGAVAQRTPVLLLDEPTAFLDPLHQELLSRALRRIHDEYGTSIITVTHDINRALTEYSHVLALLDGQMLYAGPSAEFGAKCPEVLRDLYAVGFERVSASASGRTIMVPGVLP